MVRLIYSALLSLHPAAFRERFGPEMLSIFDGSSARATLVADATLSLARQWTLRRDFHSPEPAPVRDTAGPFQFPEYGYSASRKPILIGLLPALGCFALTSFLIAHSGISGGYIIGSKRVDSAGFPIRSPTAPASLNTEVIATRADVLDTFNGREMVRVFYRMLPALRALDANHDLALSRDEIDRAPQTLRSLDRDSDGMLNVAECGWPRPRLPYQQLPGEKDVMRSNPVLSALDVDRDGRISAREIESASSTVKLLDGDGNGSLTPDEVLSAGQRKRMEEFLNDTRL